MQDGLGDTLVHADGGGEDARTDVRKVERLEVPLDHTILAEGAVENREHHRTGRQALVELSEHAVGLVVQ